MKSMIIACALATALLTAAQAQQPSPGIEANAVWARATPPGARTGVVYGTLVNREQGADHLVGVQTPVADEAQLHIETSDNGVMRMRPVKNLDLEPGEQVALKPGAMHVMLMGLKRPLKAGESFPLTFEFAHAGKVEAAVTVAKAGAMGMDGMSGQMGGHDMGSHDMGGQNMGGMSHGTMGKP